MGFARMIQHIIDIPEEMEPALWPECCIYKVPENLRKENPEAYTPKLISIGPIHHGNPELKQMEGQKRRYFRFFLDRLSKADEESWFHFLTNYKHILRRKEEEIRHCYSEKYPELSKVKFVDMILSDAVFIMELFLRQSNRFNHQNDHLISKLWLSKGIQEDLLLLENQVPISVLMNLYDDIVPGDSKVPEHTSFLDLARDYFAFYYPQEYSPRARIKLKDWKQAKHFTDLIRYFHIPRDLSYDAPSSNVLKTATKLREAGVSFEAVSNRCLLDIKFKKKPFLNWFLCLGCFPLTNCVKARFQFPELKIDDSTECILRNLIALEQCHYPMHHYICNYVSVLENLIHSKEDVEWLVEKGVIVHQLSSDEKMATMINGLCKHVVIASTCYGQIIEQLDEHYDNNWKRYMGVIRWVYFQDLWRISTTMVGLAVFLFTAINFFRAIGVINVKLSNT